MKKINIKSIVSIINHNIEKIKLTVNQADEDLLLLGLDSIEFIQIIVALEDAFKIEILDEKIIISEMRTLNDMLKVISNVSEKTKDIRR